MGKTVFSIIPDPTFSAVVDIPLPGGAKAPMTVIYKHLPSDQWAALWERCSKAKTVNDEAEALIEQILHGWEGVEDASGPLEFNADNLATVFKNFPGAAGAILASYPAAMQGALLGNSKGRLA